MTTIMIMIIKLWCFKIKFNVVNMFEFFVVFRTSTVCIKWRVTSTSVELQISEERTLKKKILFPAFYILFKGGRRVGGRRRRSQTYPRSSGHMIKSSSKKCNRNIKGNHRLKNKSRRKMTGKEWKRGRLEDQKIGKGEKNGEIYIYSSQWYKIKSW